MSKSDKKAKDAYIVHLKSNGYENVKIINSPVDISAEKNGETYYFEIKMTKKKTKYFGAATLTEWVQAFKTPNHFKFVIAITDVKEEDFKFIEFSPEEFMKHSTIPPFKIYFNINLEGNSKNKLRRSAIQLTEATMKLMSEFYNAIKIKN
jgi:Holliday junction resolvase